MEDRRILGIFETWKQNWMKHCLRKENSTVDNYTRMVKGRRKVEKEVYTNIFMMVSYLTYGHFITNYVYLE